jgi:tRNA(Ile2) C34 agmatinyltransferase TiaS
MTNETSEYTGHIQNCKECGGNVKSEVNGNFEDWRCQDCGIIVAGGRLVNTDTE